MRARSEVNLWRSYRLPPLNAADGRSWISGHVFANGDNSTIIVSIKGTSWDGLGSVLSSIATSLPPQLTSFSSPSAPAPGSTARLDRVNDNRLASCCCGHLAPTSPNVCTCFKGSRLNREKKVCDQTCVEMSMFAEDSYYVAGVVSGPSFLCLLSLTHSTDLSSPSANPGPHGPSPRSIPLGQHLAHWPLTRRRPRLAPWSHIWAAGRDVRGIPGSAGCGEVEA